MWGFGRQSATNHTHQPSFLYVAHGTPHTP